MKQAIVNTKRYSYQTFNSFEDETFRYVKWDSNKFSCLTFNSFEDETVGGRLYVPLAWVAFNSFEDET